MSETLIKVENVSKKFCRDLKRSLYYGLTDMGREMLGMDTSGMDNLRKKEFWAVDDVSFEVKRGECLGLIGKNGAGKSTLLKMLNGLIKPDKGRIEMRGRIGALIELGAGFNPILTGRENVFINASVLGLTRKETEALFEEIVDFAEIEEFIDTPVQYYSSGMKVRLGFAIASKLKPDILLVDEVLAVGDAGFRIKCYNEIYKLLDTSSVIFVSHSMVQVAKICRSAILMHNSKIRLQSDEVTSVITEYYNLFEGEEKKVEGNMHANIFRLMIADSNNEKHDLLATPSPSFSVIENMSFCIELETRINKTYTDYILVMSVEDFDQKNAIQFVFGPFKQVQEKLTLSFDLNMLNTGRYSITIQLFDFSNQVRGAILWGIRSCAKLLVQRKTVYGLAPVCFHFPG